MVGFVRLGHPFPSLLDGGLTGLLARLAGAPTDIAIRLAVAMVALQVSIGALNDLVDAERDRGRKPGKPIPSGLVGRGTARLVVAVGLGLGLALSSAVGPAALGIAALGTSAGYAYDLRLKATRWAWLPFAVGIPLLLVYAWVGATGTLAPAFALLLPLAVVAGAGLALANGIADVERDRSAGIATPATRLGRERAWRAAAALLLGASVAGAGSLVVVGADPAPLVGAAAGVGLVGIGLALGRGESPEAREHGWELSAIGLGLVAAAWALGFIGRGLL